MSHIPVGNYCRICQKLFCCQKCREAHEEKEHSQEIEQLVHEEYMKTQCYICNGLQLPFSFKEKLPANMLQHIVHYHLPLKCNRCPKIFETAEDFLLIGKCCKVEVEGKEGSKENVPAANEVNEKELTPLAQINLRWRRKSREFGKVIEEGQGDAVVKQTRPTSTPFQASFDSPFDMQISSIHYNSTSSESNQSNVSPPIVESAQKPAALIPRALISPMDKKKARAIITPLRQTVMTKSVQRAIVANEQHKKRLGIQQRRMTFDSTSSSNEKTLSLLKLEIDENNDDEPPEKLPKVQMERDDNNNSNQALDLRLSPALRREMEYKKLKVIPKIQILTVMKEEQQEIPIINVPTKEKADVQVVAASSSSNSSENTTITSLKPCAVDETISTPKVTASSGNLLKKTISFEPPRTIEKTPVMLVPRKASDGSDEEDVFYTPRATPVRRRHSMESGIISFDPLFVPEEEEEEVEAIESSPKKKKIWNLVSSAVMNFAKGRTNVPAANTAGTANEAAAGTNKFTNIGMAIRRAADYISTLPGKGANFVAKRRRHSSGSNSSGSSNTTRDSLSLSPLNKKRRIQCRKPIQRMLNKI